MYLERGYSTWESQGGGIWGSHASSAEEQEICFQKSQFKHLWWISMLRQREDNNTEGNPIGIYENPPALSSRME